MTSADSKSASVPVIKDTVESLRTHLKTHYSHLGAASRRLRFMGEPSEAALDRIADRAAPDIMLEVERDGDVRGVLEAYDAGAGHAEIALSVEDAYQGRGLGRRLFEEGLSHLARRGFRTADLYCLRENTAVLHLIRKAGGRIVFQGSEARAEIELGRILDRANPIPAA